LIRLPELAGIFMETGIHAVPVRSGEEALLRIKASKPELIFLDLVIPGMDGLAAKNYPPRAPSPLRQENTSCLLVHLVDKKLVAFVDRNVAGFASPCSETPRVG